jgi:hypothetical protein
MNAIKYKTTVTLVFSSSCNTNQLHNGIETLYCCNRKCNSGKSSVEQNKTDNMCTERCTEYALLVHTMNNQNWAHFDFWDLIAVAWGCDTGNCTERYVNDLPYSVHRLPFWTEHDQATAWLSHSFIHSAWPFTLETQIPFQACLSRWGLWRTTFVSDSNYSRDKMQKMVQEVSHSF